MAGAIDTKHGRPIAHDRTLACTGPAVKRSGQGRIFLQHCISSMANVDTLQCVASRDNGRISFRPSRLALFRAGHCPEIPEILKFALECTEVNFGPEILTNVLKFLKKQ